SGLDIDALQVVANGVNAMRSEERSFIVVTHYQRLLDYIVPDYVHVLDGGRIVRSGDKELAKELEAKGYGWIESEVARSMTDFQQEAVRLAAQQRSPAWLAGLRQQATEQWLNASWPTRKTEHWKYTLLLPLQKDGFKQW